MFQQSEPGGSRSQQRVDPPRRRVLAYALPAGAALIVVAIFVISGLDALMPARAVRVVPVLYGGDPGVAPGARSVGSRGDETGGGGARTGDRHAVVRDGTTVQAPGWLEADPFYVACTALADGLVREMLVLEGERVERGQVVARLVDDDAKLAVAQARAALESARARERVAAAELSAAESDWEHPVERERAVASAKARHEEALAELAQLPSHIQREEARLGRVRAELEQAEEALASGAATDLEVVVLRREAEAQLATLESMRRQERVLESRASALLAEVRAAERNFELRIEERRALDAARGSLAQARSEVLRAEADLAEAELFLERMVIRAPISGVVQRRFKVPGDKVMLGMDSVHSSHLVHLYDPSKIQVRVDVPLADTKHVYVGQACEVIVEVLPETVFRGEVTRITHQADLQKNTLQVKVRVIEPSPLLRPEMLTRVKFLPARADGQERPIAGEPGSSADRRSSVRVPERVVVDRSGDRGRVWVVRSRRGALGVARAVGVRVLPDGGGEGWVSVVSEADGVGVLRAGDLAISDAEGLAEGVRVEIVGVFESGGGS